MYRDISVVISGPIFKSENGGAVGGWTWKGCMSVRKVLPGAELIISTWNENDCEGLDYDVLVVSDDPGPNINNVNRQICSRVAGIRAATRKKILAIRSESEIENTNFINYFAKYQLHGKKNHRFLEERVVIPASMPPRSGELFHMGDWYYFGLKEDLLKLWELPYCDDTKINQEDDDILYNAHRYLITQFTKKYVDLNFSKKKDINSENKRLYEQILAENFVIIGVYNYGVESLKYPLKRTRIKQYWDCWASYTYSDWKKLYNKNCQGNEHISRSLQELFGVYVYAPLYTLKIFTVQKMVAIKKWIEKVL